MCDHFFFYFHLLSFLLLMLLLHLFLRISLSTIYFVFHTDLELNSWRTFGRLLSFYLSLIPWLSFCLIYINIFLFFSSRVHSHYCVFVVVVVVAVPVEICAIVSKFSTFFCECARACVKLRIFCAIKYSRN